MGNVCVCMCGTETDDRDQQETMVLINPSLLLRRSQTVEEFALCDYPIPKRLSQELKGKAKQWAVQSKVWQVRFIGEDKMSWRAKTTCGNIDIQNLLQFYSEVFPDRIIYINTGLGNCDTVVAKIIQSIAQKETQTSSDNCSDVIE